MDPIDAPLSPISTIAAVMFFIGLMIGTLIS